MQATTPRTGRSRTARLVAPALLALAGLCVAALPGGARAQAGAQCSALAPGGPACGAEPIGSADAADADRFVANPIDVVTGNKYQRREDYRAFGSRLAFSRHYNTGAVHADLGLGRGWRHDYDVSLARAGDTTVRLYQSDGRAIDFEAVGTDAALEAGISAEALSTGAVPHLPANAGDGYLLFDGRGSWHLPDGRALGFSGRYLVSVEWPDGDRLALGYRDGRLARVADRHGRAIELEYTPGRIGLDGWDPATGVTLPGHLERVVLPNGEALEYRYDNLKNLVRVDHAGETIERLGYGDRRHPNHLTELSSVDGEDKRWHYDVEGRGDGYADGLGSVLMLEHLPGTADSSGERAGRTLVKRLDGAWLDYRWRESADGSSAIEAVIEHGCATCAGVPRLMERRRRGGAGNASVDAAAGQVIEGLTVESLGTDAAVVSVGEGADRFAVRFDRRARPVVVEPLAPADGGAVSDAVAVNEVVRALHETGTVDGSGAAYRVRRKASCPPPLFRTCDELDHDRQLLELSGCAYDDYGDPCDAAKDGWKELSFYDVGLDYKHVFEGNYRARIFRNDATGELVVAFRGSDDGPDWVEDIIQMNGKATRSYELAQDLAEKLEDNGYGDVTYTGHSLGGGLATTAALASENEATVFNAAALSVDTAEELNVPLTHANRDILNVTVDGDFVTEGQDAPRRTNPPYRQTERAEDSHPARYHSNPAPGRRYPIPPPPPGSPSLNVWYPAPIRNHVMGTLKDALDDVILQQCGP